MAILSPHVESYLRELRPPRSRVMAEMEDLAERERIPIVHWETGRMLAALAGSLGARVLEVGTAIGYSALHMAEAIEGDGSIVTLERDPQRIAQARDFLGRAGVAKRVEIVEGDARDTLTELSGPFDLLFLDAMKGEYREYLELAEPKLSPNALLVVDNLLMSGQVAGGEPAGHWPAETVEAGRAFNEALMRSEQWRGAVLAVGDGVGLATRVR